MIAATKVCKGCKIEKSAEHFSKCLVKHSYGVYEYLYTYCRSCASKRACEYDKRRPKSPPKRVLLSEATKICAKCGIEKHSEEFGRVKAGRGDRFNRPSRCKACRAQRNNQWHKTNPDRSKANMDRWQANNKEHISKYNKAKRTADPKTHALRFKNWAIRNRSHLTAKANARRARKLKATPSWLSAIQQAQISEFYEIAVAKTVQTGIAHEVDHIVPLKGEVVCGLHVPWNLQVLTESQNAAKRNKHLPEAA